VLDGLAAFEGERDFPVKRWSGGRRTFSLAKKL